MSVFLNAIFGQILFSTYIGWHGYKALPRKKVYRFIFLSLIVLELLLYFTGFFFYKDLPDHIFNFILRVCGTWYIASIYLSLGLLFLDLIRLSQWIRPWYSPFIQNNYQSIKLFLFFGFGIGVSGLMCHGFYQANHPKITHEYIHISKVVEGRDSLKIALMSDLHFGELIGKTHAERFVACANSQNPDLIVIAGDVVDYESHYAINEQVDKVLQELKAPLGVYITLGNHDYRANKDAKIRWLNKTGATLLIDSVVMPDSGFYLIGRDDAINKSRSSLQPLVRNLDLKKPIIVVDHQPYSVHEAVMNQADLSLHGHTHEGQFWPYSTLLKAFVFDYFYGYYKTGNMHSFVTSGIGFAGIPYRIGTRSELVLLHISFDKP